MQKRIFYLVFVLWLFSCPPSRDNFGYSPNPIYSSTADTSRLNTFLFLLNLTVDNNASPQDKYLVTSAVTGIRLTVDQSNWSIAESDENNVSNYICSQSNGYWVTEQKCTYLVISNYHNPEDILALDTAGEFADYIDDTFKIGEHILCIEEIVLTDQNATPHRYRPKLYLPFTAEAASSSIYLGEINISISGLQEVMVP